MDLFEKLKVMKTLLIDDDKWIRDFHSLKILSIDCLTIRNKGSKAQLLNTRLNGKELADL